MDHLDKLIPLAILGVVAVFFVALLRRATRTELARPAVPIAEPMPVVEPKAVVTPPPLVVAPAKPKKRKRAPIIPAATSSPPPTTIHKVLGMLKDKDALATAFLLREILDQPTARRR